FDAHGNVFLSDFGVAKVLAEQAQSKQGTVMTGAGMILGTPYYMAPELILGQNFDARVDQYALAVMVFEMITGSYPFEGSSAPAIFIKHTTEEPPFLSKVDSAIPRTIANAVQTALAKDPAKRFPNCLAFARCVLEKGSVAVESLQPLPLATGGLA